jgi:hypothetical protein
MQKDHHPRYGHYH